MSSASCVRELVQVDVIFTVIGGHDTADAVASSRALLGYESARSRPPGDHDVGFVDFPFTDPDATFEDHLRVVEREQPKYAVAPDVEGDRDLEGVLEQADRLADHADRVIVVPKTVHPSEIPERFDVGYPNQPAFGSNGSWHRFDYWEADRVHVLGGSPDDQHDVAGYGVPVSSVDGANVKAYSEFGRVWVRPGVQEERPDLDFYERLRLSLDNMVASWEKRKPISRRQPTI